MSDNRKSYNIGLRSERVKLPCDELTGWVSEETVTGIASVGSILCQDNICCYQLSWKWKLAIIESSWSWHFECHSCTTSLEDLVQQSPGFYLCNQNRVLARDFH